MALRVKLRDVSAALNDGAVTTQSARPWKATVRTIFQMLVGIAAMSGAIYTAIAEGNPAEATGWAAVALGISSAVTRFMALPAVEAFLAEYFPWLAADPAAAGGDPGDA